MHGGDNPFEDPVSTWPMSQATTDFPRFGPTPQLRRAVSCSSTGSLGLRLIEIFVDGDGCPVKEETYVVATRYEVHVSLVANSRMSVPKDIGVELVLVEQGPDAADDWIAENVRPGDVVVTADIPLAARCLEAGARVLGTNGRAFSEDSIGSHLAVRELKTQLRESGIASGGPPPLSAKDRSRFLSKLDELVQAGLRGQHSS
jgi:uncharacterized protein YaiI (UPF0178 family)